MDKSLNALLVLVLIAFLLFKILTIAALCLLAVLSLIALFIITRQLIEYFYFKGDKFQNIKQLLANNTKECNELNKHISELKYRFIDYHSQDYGSSTYEDASIWNYKRPLINQLTNNTTNEHFCSLSVCRNAQTQPFKYLCKYFGVICDEPTLNIFEAMYNDFKAAEEAKELLLQERQEIISKYKESIPFFIRKFRQNLFFSKLGYSDIDLTDSHFPKYNFTYISAGGNSSMNCEIILDCNNLEKLINYIDLNIKRVNTIKYQRALMNNQLRNSIKMRDNYTCQICGISTKDEPHLLLEIDHIIPLSKGGRTTIKNLQTLCWRCNRKKGNKIQQQSRQ